jgi:polar amino acid transport system substrate-binding protein
MTTPLRHRTMISAVVACALATTLVACSTGSESDSTDPSSSGSDSAPNLLEGLDTTAEFDADIAAGLPEDVADAGELTVGTDATMAPKEFLDDDGKTFRGVDIDFTYAIGNVLGIKMNFVNAGFDTLLPGVQNGRYDFVASSAAPTLEREAVVDFVSIDRSGETLLVQADSADTIESIEDLCGRPAGAIKGSLQVEDLTEQSTKCEAAGDDAIEINVYPSASEVNLSLSSGRVDVAFLDTPTSAYQAANSDGDLVTTGPIYRAGLEGVFMQKDGGLAEPVAEAVNALIASGTYQEILEKWGLGDSAIETAYVNPATNGKAE